MAVSCVTPSISYASFSFLNFLDLYSSSFTHSCSIFLKHDRKVALQEGRTLIPGLLSSVRLYHSGKDLSIHFFDYEHPQISIFKHSLPNSTICSKRAAYHLLLNHSFCRFPRVLHCQIREYLAGVIVCNPLTHSLWVSCESGGGLWLASLVVFYLFRTYLGLIPMYPER